MTASPKADTCFSDGRVRLLLALIAAVLTIAGCGGGGGHSATPSPRPTSPPTVRFDRLTGPTYDIPLPQVVGGPAAVNDAMRAALAGVVAQSTDGRLTEVSKEVTLAMPRVVSVKLVLALDTGGAHGMSIVQTFVADLRAGRLLPTPDLFPAGSGWLSFLSQQSRAQLAAAQGSEDDTVRAGTEPTPEHFAHPALTPDALTITFDAYQVGPFSMGTPTVTFTRASLAAAGLSGVIDGLLGRPLK